MLRLNLSGERQIFYFASKPHTVYSISPFKCHCLVLGLTSTAFYDVICLTERQ